jgi:hypothetical protein
MEWSAFYSTLIGAGVSIVTSLIVFIATFWLENRRSMKQRQIETVEHLSVVAFSTTMKLVQIRAWLRAVRKGICECFEEANGTERENFEPGVKVQPLVGVPAAVEQFTPVELALALKSKDQGLLEKILEFQANYLVQFEMVGNFNDERSEYSKFVRDNAIAGEFIDGAAAKVVLPSGLEHAKDAFEVTLNQILGEIMSDLDLSITRSEETIVRFLSAIKSIKGIEAPIISFAVEGQNKC